MARSPIGDEPLVCESCGAKIRSGRVRCLRCGQPLSASPTPRRSETLTKLFALAGGLGVVTLAGVVATRPAAVTPAKQPEPVRAAAAKTAPSYPAVATSLDARRPGEAAYAKGDVPKALTSFQQAVDADPNDPVALNNLGQLLVRSGRPSEAIPHFDRAIELVPGEWAYHFNRARALAVQEQWASAVAGYREALRLFPDDYATQFNLATALQKSGDLKGAIEGFERAIQLAPGEADFHLSHGLALEAAQRPKDAAAAYRRYLELAASSPDAEKVKARIAALEGTPAVTP